MAAQPPLIDGNPTLAPPVTAHYGWVTVVDHAPGEAPSNANWQLLRGTIKYNQVWKREHPTVNNRDFGKFRVSFWEGNTRKYPLAVNVAFCDPGAGNLPAGWSCKMGQIDFAGAPTGPPANLIQWIYLAAPRVYPLGTQRDANGGDNRTPLIEFNARFAWAMPLHNRPANPPAITVRLDHWENTDTHSWGPVAGIGMAQPTEDPIGGHRKVPDHVPTSGFHNQNPADKQTYE